MKYAVHCGPLSRNILVGRLSSDETFFRDKEEANDMAIAAVGEYVRKNFNGAMEATFPGLGFDVTVTVTPREEGQR